MDLLLDTHTVLWVLSDDDKLSAKAKSEILSPDNNKYVSLTSAWEVAIKVNLDRLSFEGGAARFLYQIEKDRFKLLPICAEHIVRVETLPLHHKDPFDRLIVATAVVEGMAIVTTDANIHLYDIECIW